MASARRLAVAVPAALVLASIQAPAALAHGEVSIKGAQITYDATHEPTVNTVSVRATKSRRCGARRCLLLSDTTVTPGIEASGACVEGAKNSRGEVHTVYCPRRARARLSIDVGDLDDTVRIDAPIPSTIRGRTGVDRLVGSSVRDRLLGGTGDDHLFGRGGADDLVGDVGADQLDAGTGNDDVTAVDGATDKVRCGAGDDSVGADTRDSLSGDCESFTKVSDLGGSPPNLTIRADRSQRVGSDRRIELTVRSDVAVQFTVGGVVDLGRSRYRLTAAKASGTEARVSLTVPRAVVQRLRGDRRALARLDVTATDPNGNAISRPARITLRR